jgi:hypothetical protein
MKKALSKISSLHHAEKVKNTKTQDPNATEKSQSHNTNAS